MKQALAALATDTTPPGLPVPLPDRGPQLRLLTRGAEQAERGRDRGQPAGGVGAAARRRTHPGIGMTRSLREPAARQAGRRGCRSRVLVTALIVGGMALLLLLNTASAANEVRRARSAAQDAGRRRAGAGAAATRWRPAPRRPTWPRPPRARHGAGRQSGVPRVEANGRVRVMGSPRCDLTAHRWRLRPPRTRRHPRRPPQLRPRARPAGHTSTANGRAPTEREVQRQRHRARQPTPTPTPTLTLPGGNR